MSPFPKGSRLKGFQKNFRLDAKEAKMLEFLSLRFGVCESDVLRRLIEEGYKEIGPLEMKALTMMKVRRDAKLPVLKVT